MFVNSNSFLLKIVIISTLFFTSLVADFYILSGDKKVKMTALDNGDIDFSKFKKIAWVDRDNKEIHAMGNEIAFNHKHLNFRLVTIALNKSKKYSLTEWSKKAEDSSNSYYINFAKYGSEDGVMLQLFYKNRWYGVILGNPLKILRKVFLSVDVHSKEIDLDATIVSIKRARHAYPLDDKLKMVDIELEHRRANEAYKSSKHSTPNNKPIKVFFN